MSGPSSNDTSYSNLVRGGSGATADDTLPNAVVLDLQPTPHSPDDRLEEQTAEGCKQGGGTGAAVVGGGGAGLAMSDEGLESEVDVLGVRDSRITCPRVVDVRRWFVLAY